MVLSDYKSLGKKMDSNREARFARLFELLKQCYLSAERLDGLLAERLSSSVGLDRGDSLDRIAADACIFASGFVDYASRFLEVAQMLPFISKSKEPMKGLVRDLPPVTKARNYLQHINQDLSGSPDLRLPTLGSLCWIHDGSCHVLTIDQLADYEFASMSYDTHLRQWTSLREYHIGGHIIQFDHTLREMRKFLASVLSAIHTNVPSLKELNLGTARTMKLTIPEQTAQPAASENGDKSPPLS